MKHINYNKNLRIFFLSLLAATIFDSKDRKTIKKDKEKITDVIIFENDLDTKG